MQIEDNNENNNEDKFLNSDLTSDEAKPLVSGVMRISKPSHWVKYCTEISNWFFELIILQGRSPLQSTFVFALHHVTLWLL